MRSIFFMKECFVGVGMRFECDLRIFLLEFEEDLFDFSTGRTPFMGMKMQRWSLRVVGYYDGE